MAKENNLLHPALLMALSAALLSAAWLMKPFPVLIFAALAPLFAITDHTRDHEHFWSLSELILAALTAGFLAAHTFSMSFLVISLVEAIALTLAFLAYSYSYQQLGNWVGKFLIILFWLAIEYAFLKLPWRNQFTFLADVIGLQPNWIKWTQETGYLGVTLWVLTANLLVYLAVFRGKVNWAWVSLALVAIAGPIGYSYWHGGEVISRTDMIALYSHKISSLHQNYILRGEIITSTSAILSILILLISYFQTKAHTS